MADEQALGAGRMTRPRRSAYRSLLGAALHEEGQALVEFAIVVPLILLLVLGIVDFGLAYNFKNDQTSLANQALRYAEVNDCAPCGALSIEDYVWSTADSGELRDGTTSGVGIKKQADNRGVDISFCLPSGQPAKDGDPIRAVVRSDYIWLPFLKLSPGQVPLVSEATGRIEPGAVEQPSGPVDFSTLSLC
jgi:hypothetical protein